MTASQRFCEECGKPLLPGVKFCEECGSPAGVMESPPSPDLAFPVSSETGPLPLAVIPFAYQHRGAFSIEQLTLVVYSDRLIFAVIPKERQADFDQAQMEVSAELMGKHLQGKSFWQLATHAGFALFKLAWSPVDFYTADAVKEQKMLRNISIPTRPWERYLSMPADEVLAEDGRNRAIPRKSIAFIRGESDPSTSTDQVIILSAEGPQTLFFEFGIYSLARKVLFSFIFPGIAGNERIIGVIPFAEEPEVEGFGFQYTWNVVVTDQRLIFCMVEDEFADASTEWITAKSKEKRKNGMKFQEGNLAGQQDAPWQRFMQKPVSSLLENEVNFFIPLSSIRSVDLIPGGPGQADELCFHVPGEPYDILFPGGTAGHIRILLETVMEDKMKES